MTEEWRRDVTVDGEVRRETDEERARETDHRGETSRGWETALRCTCGFDARTLAGLKQHQRAGQHGVWFDRERAARHRQVGRANGSTGVGGDPEQAVFDRCRLGIPPQKSSHGRTHFNVSRSGLENGSRQFEVEVRVKWTSDVSKWKQFEVTLEETVRRALQLGDDDEMSVEVMAERMTRLSVDTDRAAEKQAQLIQEVGLLVFGEREAPSAWKGREKSTDGTLGTARK
eukprot:SAG11_NODE_7639_length_1117_cov_1.353635_1_plen_228_part_10